MHLVLAAADSKEALQQELAQAFPEQTRELLGGVFACSSADPQVGPLPHLAFARQLLPFAQEVSAASIRAWASMLVERVVEALPDQQPWSLHVFPYTERSEATRMGARAWHTQARTAQRSANPAQGIDGSAQGIQAGPPKAREAVGQNRCRLIREATVELLQKKRRHLLRYLRQDAGMFGEDETLVQLLLTDPGQGFLSVAKAPFPFQQRHVLACFPGGEVPVAIDKSAPSRAFAKLVEAEARMCRRIVARDLCVDLGASPGSWSYVAARRGARVTAVDRAELRPDLMQLRNIEFQRGDAFRFEPPEPVDWLLCDVIAAAERSAGLLLRWLDRSWCQHFIVTLKVDDAGSNSVLARLKQELPGLTRELWLTRLSSNKKEVCAFGTIREA